MTPDVTVGFSFLDPTIVEFLFARHFHDLIMLDTFSAVNRNFVVTAILFYFCS